MNLAVPKTLLFGLGNSILHESLPKILISITKIGEKNWYQLFTSNSFNLCILGVNLNLSTSTAKGGCQCYNN